MKYITYLNILSKLIFTVAIFIFVQKQSDYYLVPLLTSVGFLVAGIWSLILIKKEFDLSFDLQSLENIKHYLVDGWDIFVSKAFSICYRDSNIIILGLLTNNLFVGYYAIAEKIIKLFQTMQNVVGNVLFPYTTRRFKNDASLFFILNKKYFKYIFATYFVFFLVVLLISKYIVLFINGDFNSSMILNLQIMSVVILIGGLNYYFGILGLVSLNYKKEFSSYVINTGIFNILFCTCAIYLWNDLGASIVFVLSELILLLQIILKINKIKREYKC